MPALHLIAKRLRVLRESRGLTQEEFAERAGVSYKFYQQIESGRKKQIWLETVERLAAGFGLEAWQLLTPVTAPLAVSEHAAPYGGRAKSAPRRLGRRKGKPQR